MEPSKLYVAGFSILVCNGLLTQGFKQSTIDPCLFFCHNCILVVYTDDCLIFSLSVPQVQSIIQSLQKNFLLKDKGEVKDFLGICIHRDPIACTITLTQPGLINSVLTELRLLSPDDWPVQHKFMPATSILYPDTNGTPCQEHWHYCSVISKLNFITANT